MTKRWQKELGLAALLAVLALVAYGQLLRPGHSPYSPFSDIIAQHLAMKQVAYRNLQAGHGLPFWKSDLMAGGPALTHPQAVFTHPLHWPFLLFEPVAAAGPSVWLHLLTMALALQWLGAVMGLGLWARILMSVSGLFAFKLILITYSGWLPVLPSFVCAPLLFAGVFLVMERPGIGSTLALAAAGSLCLHGGHLQIFYYSTLFLGAYVGVAALAWLRAGQTRHAGRVLAACAAAGVVAAASVAYLMLPLAAETGLTTRTATGYDFFLARGQYAVAGLTTFLHPEAQGTPLEHSYARTELWEDVAYFGAVAEVLALVGAVLGWHRPRTRFLVIALVLSTAMVFDSPFLRLCYEWVPGFSLFRIPSRFLFVTSILGFALAGIGADELWRRLRGFAERSDAKRYWVPHLVMASLLVVAAGEGVYYAKRYVDVAPADAVVPSPAYLELFAADRDVYRVAPLGRSTLNYGWSALFDLQLLTGFDAYNFRHFLDLYETMVLGGVSPQPGTTVWVDLKRIARWDLLDEFNVKYLLAPRPLRDTPPQLEVVAQFAGQPNFTLYSGFDEGALHVYENRNVQPRARWASEVVVARGDLDAAELVSRRNLRRSTVVEDSEGSARYLGRPDGAAVEIAEARDGLLALRTVNPERGYLIASEIWHPGWQARVDGEPAPIHRTNLALMGLWVPEGSHRVELRFEPLHWQLARAISGAALLGGLATAAGLAIRALRAKGLVQE